MECAGGRRHGDMERKQTEWPKDVWDRERLAGTDGYG